MIRRFFIPRFSKTLTRYFSICPEVEIKSEDPLLAISKLVENYESNNLSYSKDERAFLSDWFNLTSRKKLEIVRKLPNHLLPSAFVDVDVWVRDLPIEDVIELLGIAAKSGVRELSASFPDVPTECAVVLHHRLAELSLPQLNEAATAFARLNFRHLAFLEGACPHVVALAEARLARNGRLLEKDVMPFLSACARLHVLPSQARRLFDLLEAPIKDSRSLSRLSQVVQIGIKMNLTSHSTVIAALDRVRTDLATLAEEERFKENISVGVCRLVLALCLPPPSLHSETDRALAACLNFLLSTEVGRAAVDATPTRAIFRGQMQTVGLCVELERPVTLALLNNESREQLRLLAEEKDSSSTALSPLLPRTRAQLSASMAQMPMQTSNHHFEVSDALRDINVRHKLEVSLPGGYVGDVVIKRNDLPGLGMLLAGGVSVPAQLASLKGVVIEVDGPTHFQLGTKDWQAKSVLKHRLLTRLGWKVLHLAYFDWPRQRQNRQVAVARLLETALKVNQDFSSTAYEVQFSDILLAEGVEDVETEIKAKLKVPTM